MKTRLVLCIGVILLGVLAIAPPLRAGEAIPSAETLKRLIRLAEAGLAGFELEDEELSELARTLDRADMRGPEGGTDRQLALRAYRLSSRELIKCTAEFETALAAGERQQALRIFEREFIPLCLDLAVCQAAASMGAAPSP